MKVLFVTGNHVRHFYLVNKFTNFFKKFVLVSEKRNITNNHYSLLNKKVYKNHINDFFYKEKKILNLNIKKFEKKNSNKIYYFERDKKTSKQFNFFLLNLIKKENPKLLIAYGCQKINKNILNHLKAFNIHGGLLPSYRGVNTNFWPHFNKESNKVGMTLHSMTSQLDIGEIFFQTTVRIKDYYNINSISCYAVKNFCKYIPKKFYKLSKKKKIKGKKILNSNKIWKKKDFKVNKIKIAYRNLENFKKKYLKDKKRYNFPDLINVI